MVNVIGVRFENAGKLYFFTPGALWPTPGDFVIVETTRGIEFGEVVTEVREIAAGSFFESCICNKTHKNMRFMMKVTARLDIVILKAL